MNHRLAHFFPLIPLACAALTCTVLAAPPSAPPPVTLTERGDVAVLANGALSVTIAKASATLRSVRFSGREFVRQGGGAYFSMDGGANFRVPSGCAFAVTARNDDLVDIAMRQNGSGQHQAVDIEVHYVLRRGDTGLYTYAILEHPAAYPATRFGEWRMVWKLPDDLLDTIHVDALRTRLMPTAAELASAEPTAIKEILKLRSGKRAGLFECKYDYNANYQTTPFWGHADTRSGLGAWMVFGAHEWFNDGPTKQDLTSAERILHVHFGMNHYNGSGIALAAGESWRKLYGPFLLYLNQPAASPAEAARDASRRAEAERAAWPYAWLAGQPEYPPAAGRGGVSGHLVLRDAAKPALTSAGAWVGLAQPEAGGNWQFESKHYQYWTRATADGNFSIPHVRPGTYTLYAFGDGAVGEFARSGIAVAAAAVTRLGEVTWTIPRESGRLVWEIGTPDRSAAEFRHGDDYFQGFLWTRFADEWPNPLEFTIGRSDPARDWNYAQSGYPARPNHLEPWRWRIHFQLEHAPAAAATLTLAIASADGARLDIFANAEDHPVATCTPAVQGGNALLREAIHAKYCVHRITIPAAVLHQGPNTITLVQSRTQSPQFHVMYDYLSLEVPDDARPAGP